MIFVITPLGCDIPPPASSTHLMSMLITMYPRMDDNSIASRQQYPGQTNRFSIIERTEPAD
jgi:hypothetical protein